MSDEDKKVEEEYDDAECWLCSCGNYIEDGCHCECGEEPPWGCPCSFCQGGDDSDEDDDDYEIFYDPYDLSDSL